jgi:hypothetical protein
VCARQRSEDFQDFQDFLIRGAEARPSSPVLCFSRRLVVLGVVSGWCCVSCARFD